MTAIRTKHIFLLLALGLFLLSKNAIAQNNDEDAKPDTSDYIPFFYKGALDYNLMIAAMHGNAAELNRLILKGADLFAETEQGATALIFAVVNNHTDVAKLLIDYGCDINKVTSQGDTPFFLAVKNGNAEITEALIRAGVDIDMTDRYDATGLHYAAGYNFLALADMLIYYDASLEKKTIEGSTPLIAAVFTGNTDVADLLLQNGANIEATDYEGFTPFLIAAMNGDTLLMDMLYKKGANIYATNNIHHNALTLSIISNQPEAVKFLLKIGNGWTTSDTQALSPYVVAAKYQRKEIVRILQEKNVPGHVSYSIDQLNIMLSTRFLLHDMYTGMSFSFREPYLNAGIILGFDTKLWYTRVLTKYSENYYYQYWDKESIIYAGLFKNFELTDNAYKGNFELSTSLTGGYRFASELKGTRVTPQDKFMIIPAVSLKYTTKNFSYSLGTEYINSDFYKVNPVWIRLGVSYNLYFDKVRSKRKSLRWL